MLTSSVGIAIPHWSPSKQANEQPGIKLSVNKSVLLTETSSVELIKS